MASPTSQSGVASPPPATDASEKPPTLADPGARPILSIRDLTVEFVSRRTLGKPRVHRVLDAVSLDLWPGEALGIVGESGCGKTTLGLAILRLIPASRGSIAFDGTDLLALKGAPLRSLRRCMQVIFQDPAGSLNPRMRIGDIVREPLDVHAIGSSADRHARVLHLLDRCGMPADAARRYPHQLSGGQRQRVAIARALALNPSLIVCDEPTSALDVSIQAQILNLLKDLQQELGLSYLFISHDLAVVAHLCRRIAVMRAGRIIECAPTDEILHAPKDPYTRELLNAVPSRDLLAPSPSSDIRAQSTFSSSTP